MEQYMKRPRQKNRFLPELTHRQIKDMPDKGNVVLILSLGTVEQHGSHLPLFTDSIISSEIVTRALDRLDPNIPAYALAPIFYGKSTEHDAYCGTISISADTLISMIKEIITSIYNAGFRKIILANGHGGQPQVLEIAARDSLIGRENLMIIPCSIGAPYNLPDELWPSLKEKEQGIHGGFLETSLILALRNDLVNMSEAKAEYPTSYSSKFLTLEGKMSPAWLTHHISKNGIVGDPTAANREIGEKIIENMITEWCDFIKDVSSLDVYHHD